MVREWLIPVSVSLSVLGVSTCLCIEILGSKQMVNTTVQGEAAAIRQLVNAQADATRTELLAEAKRQGDAIRTETLAEVRHLTDKADTAISRADFRLGQGLAVVDQHLGEINATLAKTSETVSGFRQDLLPTLGSANALLRTYQELPDRVGSQVAPAYYSLLPEITCRTLAGDGYGGCWHSRVTALMGEAARVGGVFTQKFPGLADSVTGIAADAHGWTSKYVAPHPMKLGDYFKSAGKITIGLGTAALRGGVF